VTFFFPNSRRSRGRVETVCDWRHSSAKTVTNSCQHNAMHRNRQSPSASARDPAAEIEGAGHTTGKSPIFVTAAVREILFERGVPNVVEEPDAAAW
jgi:hypothetical protein